MRIDLENLPCDTLLLHRLVRDMAGVVDSRDGEIERLQLIIKKLQRAQFGRSSERFDPDQLALALEEVDSDIARIQESRPAIEAKASEPVSRGANPCPIICRARRSCSILPHKLVQAVAVLCIRLARASPKCLTGCLRSFGYCASSGLNMPAAPVEHSFKFSRQNG